MSFGTENKRTGANNNGSDEWYTPAEAIEPLLPFLKPGSRILCPFDTADSNYVKVLGRDHIVIHSHIAEGQDFFDLVRPDVDYVISNPPYSRRTDVIRRLYEWDIPFAMMFNSNGIMDNRARFSLAQRHGAEIMYLYPRVEYISPDGKKSAPRICPRTGVAEYWQRVRCLLIRAIN